MGESTLRRKRLTTKALDPVLGLLATCMLAAGCTEDSALAPPGQVIAEFDRRLEETPELHLARPGQFSIGPGGLLAVTDHFYQRVLLFDAEGRLEQVLGARGRGPGEFQMIGDLVFLDEHTLAVFDDAKRTAQIFSLNSGEYRGALPITARAYSIVRLGDTLYVGSNDPETGSLAARYTISDSTLIRIGRQPEAYATVHPLSAIHGLIPLSAGPEHIVLGVSGMDSLYIHDRGSGERSRQTWLPAVHRRQTPPELPDLRRAFGSPRDPSDLWRASSFLLGVRERSTGDILLLHMDQDLSGQVITSRPYVSMISADLGTGCR